MSQRNKMKSACSFNPTKVMKKLYRAVLTDLNADNTEYNVSGQQSFYFRETQINNFYKEFVDPSESYTSQEQAAIDTFLAVNEHIKVFNEKGDLPFHVIKPFRLNPPRTRMLIRARNLIHQILGELSEDEFFSGCRHTSGSSVGVNFLDTRTDKKFQSPISITQDAVPLMKRYFEWNPQLGDYCSYKHDLMCSEDKALDSNMFRFVEGSHSFTVPKNNEKRRFAAKEPTGNLFLQKGMEAVITSRLREAGLDLATLQESHRRIAEQSSITTQFATIDFSSASDCISTYLVKWLLPPSWFMVLYAIKSRMIKIADVWVKMHMFSNMGNACTFPLETLIFYALACASQHDAFPNSVHISYESRIGVSVFGDDTIIPDRSATQFIELAESCGLIVNKAKSHHGMMDRFRESCGGDFLQGRSVRPFMTNGPRGNKVSDLEAWLYVILNGLLKKYMSYFSELTYVYDKKLFRLIKNLFKEYNLKLKIVPPYFPDDSGLRYFSDIERFLLNYRFPSTDVWFDRHGLAYFSFLKFDLFRGKSFQRQYDSGYDYYLQLVRRVSLPEVYAHDMGFSQTKSNYGLRHSYQKSSSPLRVSVRKGSYKGCEGVGWLPNIAQETLDFLAWKVRR